MTGRLRRSLVALTDLARVTRAFATSSAFRGAALTALAQPGSITEPTPLQRRELERVPAAARPYAGLAPSSLALAGLRPGASAPTLGLVVPEYEPSRVFAGVHTAVRIAAELAAELSLRLRIVVLSESTEPSAVDAVRRDVTERAGINDVDVVVRARIPEASTHPGDLWIVTHWTTAHAAAVACRAGVLDPSRVVYLVQDHEPGFLPVSTDRALASATYREGFWLLVNSQPVAEALRRHEGVAVPPDRVFAPDLDLPRLSAIAAERRSGAPPRVLFYGRPSKPRNMFGLGIAALRLAAAQSKGPVEWVSAGEAHGDIELAPGCRLVSLGTLSWDRYFEELARATVVVSLQASPHPSHPPLEAALSGALAVTNEVDHTREGLLPNLRVADADADSLSAAIVEALERSATPADSLDGLGVARAAALQSLIGALRR